MLRLTLWLWILSPLCLAVAVTDPPAGHPTAFPGLSTSTTTVKEPSTAKQSTENVVATDTTKSTPVVSNNDPNTSSSSTPSQTTGAVVVNGGQGGQSTSGGTNNLATSTSTPIVDGQPQSTGSSSAPLTENQHSSGLSSTAKLGLGIGVGVGVPLIAGLIALLFFLRRRRSHTRYSSGGVSAQHLREQPAMMSSNGPALAGMSDMGRSLSKHSLARTPSQHSLVPMPEPLPPLEQQPQQQQQPAIVLPPVQQQQQVPTREVSQRSAAPSWTERDNLMPSLPPYEDVPSPLEEHEREPVSPVSPISPAGSRPPSPFDEHGR